MIKRVEQRQTSIISHGWLRRVLLAALILAAAWLAMTALSRMALLLSYPYSHDGLEGTLLYEARLWRSGQPLYQPLELYRFVSAPYPPLHYLFLGLFDLLPGPHIFWAGRLLSLLAGLGVAALAALIIRRTGAAWAVAALAAALVLSIPPLQLWSSRIKPDMLALLFTSAGLYCATVALTPRWPSHQRFAAGRQTLIETDLALALQTRQRWTVNPLLLLAVILFVLAFFTKQTAAAGPLAVGLALLAGDLRDWHSNANPGRWPLRWRTILFVGVYLGLVAAIWGLLDLITAGQYTLHVWWAGKRTEWWTFLLFSKIIVLLGYWWPQMILAALAVFYSWKWRRLFVPVCYLLVVPLTLLGTGEQGANHNHLLETHLALALAGCAALGILCPAKPATATSATGLPWRASMSMLLLVGLLTAAQVYQASHPPDWYAGELAPSDPPERYLNFIRNTPGEILADDTGLLFQAGRELRYDDPSTMGPAARIGAWDQRGMVEEINQKKFSAIILPVNIEKSIIDPTGRWTPEMLQAIKTHYQLKFRDTLYIYVPR